MSAVAESIHPKSGRACSSTNNGTTTTTASDFATAPAVSVVADRLRPSPRPGHLRQVLAQVRLARERLGPGVHLLHHAGVHIRAEHLVPRPRELHSQRQTDLAQTHNGDLQGCSFALGGAGVDPRASGPAAPSGHGPARARAHALLSAP